MKRYNAILCDPPWDFNNKNTGGSMTSGADAIYTTMTVEEIKRFDVNSIAEDNSILFMWWVASQPKEAIELVEAWGFEIKTMTGFAWMKLTKSKKFTRRIRRFFGMGFYTRASSENCLIAVKGKAASKLVKKRNVRSLIVARVEDHSKKPDCVRGRINKMLGDVPKLEMFARQKTRGWDVFGDEISNSIDIPLKPLEDV